MSVVQSRFPLFLFIALLLVFSASCSDDHDKPVYDTVANPENFPQPAVALIAEIERGDLNDYESIVDRFATLYADHLDLVDNEVWRNIITNLGYRFEQRADSLVALGIPHYYQAGGLYALASFARPEEPALLTLKEQFDGWRTMVDRDFVPAAFLTDTLTPTQHERLEVYRRLFMADSVFADFAERYLIPELGDDPGSLARSDLSADDRVFLQYAGLLPGLPDSSLLQFSDPKISLMHLAVIQMQPNRYRVEAYFISHEPIGVDYVVACRVEVADSTLFTERFGDKHYLPFDFYPLKPTSTWSPGELQAAVHAFYTQETPGELALGMYLPEVEPRAYLPIAGKSQYLAVFPDSIIQFLR